MIILDEPWLYLHLTCGFVRVYPGDETPDPISLDTKSYPEVNVLHLNDLSRIKIIMEKLASGDSIL